jgi:hypothetical protein
MNTGLPAHCSTISTCVSISKARLKELEYIEKNYVNIIIAGVEKKLKEEKVETKVKDSK